MLGASKILKCQFSLTNEVFYANNYSSLENDICGKKVLKLILYLKVFMHLTYIALLENLASIFNFIWYVFDGLVVFGKFVVDICGRQVYRLVNWSIYQLPSLCTSKLKC